MPADAAPRTIPRETLMSMSGLEAMQAILEGRLPGPPIAALLGFRLHAVEAGRVAFRGAPPEAAVNPMGTVHGGWYGTLLDSAMACAVMTTVPRGSAYTTLEYKVNLVRALPVGAEIEAVGRVQHPGRRAGVAAGEMRGLDGRLFATGSTTCLVFTL